MTAFSDTNDYADWTLYVKDDEDVEPKHTSIAYQIGGTVSDWYVTLRNIALVGSLTILVYIGIRIIISSSSADKSKYKQRILDWIVSIALIFTMHYIMAGSNLIVKKISGVLNSVSTDVVVEAKRIDEPGQKEKIVNALVDNSDLLLKYGEIDDINNIESEEGLIHNEDGVDVLVWKTNSTGSFRMLANEMEAEGSFHYVGYVIAFGAIVVLMVTFIFTYFKRVLYMAFLTLIAPLVAMTYSLDKLKDGQAQGFNIWFREYMINLIIQPIHLLLYTVLVSSAIQLATQNVLYMIIAIAFMIPAEKLVRRMFGVNTTETQGLLAGPAGAALAMTGLNRLLNKRPQEKKIEDKDAIRFKTSSLNTDEEFSLGGGQQQNPPVGGQQQNPPVGGQQQNPPGGGQQQNQPVGGQQQNPPVGGQQQNQPVGGQQQNQPVGGQQQNQPVGGQQQNQPVGGQQQNPPAGRNPSRRRAGNSKIRAIGSVFGAGGRSVKRKITNPKTYRGVLRGALGLASGIGAGAIGLSLGVASGDMSKAFQYGTSAGIAGLQFGKGMGGYAYDSAVTVGQGIRDAAQQGYYGDPEDYYETVRERESKKRAEEILKDDEWIAKFARIRGQSIYQTRKYLKKNKKEILEKGIAYGLNDASDFAVVDYAREEMGRTDGSEFRLAKLVKQQSSALTAAADDDDRKQSLIKSYNDRIKKQNGGREDMATAQRIYEDLSELNNKIYMKK